MSTNAQDATTLAREVEVLKAKLAVAVSVRKRNQKSLDREAELLVYLKVQRTVFDVADTFELSVVRAREMLYELHDAALIHISGYTQPKTGRPRMLYNAGQGEDAEKPLAMTDAERVARAKRRARRDEGARNAADVMATVQNLHAICTAAEATYGDILREINKSDGERIGLRVDQLVDRIGAKPELIRAYLDVARSMGKAHIGRYEHNRHKALLPVWVAGEGEDAPMVPMPLGRKKRVEVTVRRDPLTAAFFGGVS